MKTAMSKCRGCGGLVAKNAKACPHCGCKAPGRFQRNINKGAVNPWLVIVVVVVLALMFT